MPIYEYMCKSCNHCFEDFRPAAEADTKTKCPECGKKKIERQMSAFCTGASGGGGGGELAAQSAGCGGGGGQFK